MDFASLHELLRSTYDEMMPLCAQMTDIAKGIAGLGALFYIALRVWASIARAEAIDVFPLLRPSCWASASCSSRQSYSVR